MFLKSKMIYDPTQTSRFLQQGNKMGLTIGFTHRTPKYWSCKDRNFDAGWHYVSPPLSVETLDRRIDEGLWHRENCRWPYRHKSYKGYIYFTGPTHRYTFYYQGYTGIGPKHGIFTRRKHNTYTRWFDNGPQSPPRKPIEKEHLNFVRDLHKKEWAEIQQQFADRRKERGLL